MSHVRTKLAFSVAAVARQEALIDTEVASYRRSMFAESTQKTYLSQLRVYLRFCLYFGYRIVPATTQTLIRYCIFLARNHVPSSVRQYLNVVRIIHLDNYLPNPLENNFPLRSVLKGIDRVHGRPPVRKLPITPVLLRMFYELLDMSKNFDIVFFSACVVAFYTFFRKSTLLSPSLLKHNPDLHLCRRDVTFCDQGILIKVRHNKTIQCHERLLPVPMLPSGGALCPVKAIVRLWQKFPNMPLEAPLFSYMESGKLKCVDYNGFVDKVRTLVARCGLNPNDYSGHSFRRGGCTWAWQQGVSPEYIMAQGDWRSSSWMAYVDIPMAARWRMAQIMSQSIRD